MERLCIDWLFQEILLGRVLALELYQARRLHRRHSNMFAHSEGFMRRCRIAFKERWNFLAPDAVNIGRVLLTKYFRRN